MWKPKSTNNNETPRFTEPLPMVIVESKPINGRPGAFDTSALREVRLNAERRVLRVRGRTLTA